MINNSILAFLIVLLTAKSCSSLLSSLPKGSKMHISQQCLQQTRCSVRVPGFTMQGSVESKWLLSKLSLRINRQLLNPILSGGILAGGLHAVTGTI